MINDYATVQAAVSSWLARADLAASVPDFIQLAEARFNRELRISKMQVTVTGTITAGVLTLPTDLREILTIGVSVGGRYKELSPLTPQQILNATTSGYPVGYVIVNDELNLVGFNGDMAYVMVYWQTIPSLSASNPQNWLIIREPGLYLYGALCESAPFLKEDQRLVTWGALFRSISDGMEREDARYRYANAPYMQPGLTCAP